MSEEFGKYRKENLGIMRWKIEEKYI